MNENRSALMVSISDARFNIPSHYFITLNLDDDDSRVSLYKFLLLCFKLINIEKNRYLHKGQEP